MNEYFTPRQQLAAKAIEHNWSRNVLNIHIDQHSTVAFDRHSAYGRFQQTQCTGNACHAAPAASSICWQGIV
jgi:hypothetical protein